MADSYYIRSLALTFMETLLLTLRDTYRSNYLVEKALMRSLWLAQWRQGLRIIQVLTMVNIRVTHIEAVFFL